MIIYNNLKIQTMELISGILFISLYYFSLSSGWKSKKDDKAGNFSLNDFALFIIFADIMYVQTSAWTVGWKASKALRIHDSVDMRLGCIRHPRRATLGVWYCDARPQILSANATRIFFTSIPCFHLSPTSFIVSLSTLADCKILHCNIILYWDNTQK